MVVEDDFIIALDLCWNIEMLGATVQGPAPSVKDALFILDQDRPDIALLDVDLGREKVWPVADALMSRSIPFVFVSGQVCLLGAIPDRFDEALRVAKPAEMSVIVGLMGASLKKAA